MQTSNKNILFLGKKNDTHCLTVLEFCQHHFADVSVYLGDWEDEFPEDIQHWEGDLIISYLSRWIVPEHILAKAKVAAINFHPASPEYPGIGCNNFALYDNAEEYGVTCHHMLASVDTGDIIAVKRFPVYNSDDVASLLTRTYFFQLILFYDIMGTLLSNQPLPQSHEQWRRKPYSRKAFNDLATITLDMTPDEIQRRVKATSFGVWQPKIELAGFTFELKR